MDNRAGVIMQKYEMGRLLGQGTFAKVFYARSLKTGERVAIKMIDKEKVLSKIGLVEQIKREVSVMGMIRHPYIVNLYEVMASKTKIYIVMEYAKGGELFDKVAKGRLKEDVAQKLFRQLISAIDFCHSRGVYHRDLKPENLLLDEHENLKVTDFGLSALAETKHHDGLLHTRCGTPSYVAPEVLHQKGYDGAKADIWSCGVILFVLLAGYLPFHDSNLMQMYGKIERAEYKVPSHFPKDARRLLMKILDPNPETRISIAKIKESRWFRKDLTPKPAESGSDSQQPQDIPHVHTNGDPGPSRSSITDEESRQDFVAPAELNAFDLISLSRGFDLSGLLEGCGQRKEARFTSRQPASVIISRLIETAKALRLNVRRKDKGLLNFEGLNEGRKGILSIDAEILELTPALYMVEMRKSNGDTLEYHKVLKEDMRPALRDIVWAWQGERQQRKPLLEEQSQNQQVEQQVQSQQPS